MGFIANLLVKIGMGAAISGTQGCCYWLIDEPYMPKSLLQK